MDLREIGAMLREERERQGLSIDEVSDSIKITRTCLAAIEEGNASLLPHPVYAKGFIKNYAKLLGLDHDAFRKDLAEVYSLDESPLREAPAYEELPKVDCGCLSQSGGRVRPFRVVIALLVLAALSGGGWYGYTHLVSKASVPAVTPQPVAENAPTQIASAPETAAPVVADQTPAQVVPTVPPAAPSPDAPNAIMPPQSAEIASGEPVAVPAAPGTSAPMGEPTPEDRATQAIATSGPASASTAEVPPALADSTGANTAGSSFTVGDHGNHVVTITATARCWMQAGADGGSMHERMLEKGEVFTGRFADYLLVRLGNAGAVDIRFDNKLYPLQAAKGSVKTLKFVAKKPGSEKPESAVAPAVASPAENAAAASGDAAGAAAAKEVEIFGQDGSWVSVHPDKGPAKDVYVKKGQRITIPFGDKIEIRLGNPSSVIFRYNGNETPVKTERGESKTVRFP